MTGAPGPRNAITDVAGILVGHHHRLDLGAALGSGWATGATVVRVPGGATAAVDPASAVDVKSLHSKIGELTLENDFLSGALGKAGLLPSARR